MAGFEPLSPWEAMPWFDTPTQRTVPVGMGTQLLVPTEVRRVLLVISNNTGGTIWIGLNPLQVSNEGIPLQSLGPPLVINHEWWGPMVQQAWYYTSTIMGQSLTVHEVTLRDWPKGEPKDAGQIPTDAVANFDPRVQRFISRNRRTKP